MRIVQVIILGGGDCCGPESQQPRVHEMAVQVPHRTEVKLIAAIVEKPPRVRLPASRTSAHADLYDRMEQALCECVANAVEVVRSDISPALLVHTGPNLVGVAVQGL